MQLPESRLGDVPPPVTDGTLAQRALQVSLLVAELPPSWRMQLSMHCIRSVAADAGPALSPKTDPEAGNKM